MVGQLKAWALGGALQQRVRQRPAPEAQNFRRKTLTLESRGWQTSARASDERSNSCLIDLSTNRPTESRVHDAATTDVPGIEAEALREMRHVSWLAPRKLPASESEQDAGTLKLSNGQRYDRRRVERVPTGHGLHDTAL